MEHFDQCPAGTGRRECQNSQVLKTARHGATFHGLGNLRQVIQLQQAVIRLHVVVDQLRDLSVIEILDARFGKALQRFSQCRLAECCPHRIGPLAILQKQWACSVRFQIFQLAVGQRVLQTADGVTALGQFDGGAEQVSQLELAELAPGIIQHGRSTGDGGGRVAAPPA